MVPPHPIRIKRKAAPAKLKENFRYLLLHPEACILLAASIPHNKEIRMPHGTNTGSESQFNVMLSEDVRKFTDTIISEQFEQEELETQADVLMERHGLNENELVSEVYGRLLLLARFCQCRQ